jgi:TolB-like protein/DNA-binding SARP family transcriptional activator/Tfp pilus assembly protein PilF
LFRLKLFGSASIEGPDGPVTGRAVQRRRLALLALLALARQRGLTRDRLIGYLWPDSDSERARHLLSDSVYRINQAVGGEAISAFGEELRLNPQRLPTTPGSSPMPWTRATGNEPWPSTPPPSSMASSSRTPRSSRSGWTVSGSGSHASARARLEQLAVSAEQAGADDRAIHWWRVLAADDPHSSRIALRLMRALDRTGDRAAALQHARVHSVLLQEDLGLVPDAEILAFVDELRRPRPVTDADALVVRNTRLVPDQPPDGTKSGDAAGAAPHAIPAGHVAADPSHDAADAALDTTADRHAASRSSQDAVTRAPATAARRPSMRGTVLRIAAVLLFAVAIVTAITMRRSGSASSIAVLPFADLSGGEYEYFADGITEELIARLGQVEGMSVVGRTSAFSYKGQAVDVRDVAQRLNVSSVLEGSVRHSGDRVRIVAQLSDARNGYQIWTETYERQAADVFEIQDDIARAIVTRLRGRVSDSDSSRLATHTTTDVEAFNLYLKGRYQWHRRTEQSLHAAREFFAAAIERAPDYARAHAGLGDAYAILGFYDWMPPREAFPAAAAAARRALALEPALAEPHATIAYVALYYEWDWDGAEREFRRAIELAPGYSTAHQWYANLLTAMGRFDEAVAEMSEAMRLDPLSLIANAALCWSHYYAREYTTAVNQCTRALDLDSSFALAWLWRAWARGALGDHDAALADYERAAELSGSAIHIAGLARGYAAAGGEDRARDLLRELQQRAGGYVPPYELAQVHVALGDTAAALAALDRAYEHRSHSMAFLAVEPWFQPLHASPRFQRLIRELRLERS